MTTNNQTSIASLTIKRRTYSAEFNQEKIEKLEAFLADLDDKV